MSLSSSKLTKIIRATSLVFPSLTSGCGPAFSKRVYLDEDEKPVAETKKNYARQTRFLWDQRDSRSSSGQGEVEPAGSID